MPPRGFTLLELLVVLAIAAVAVTVVGWRADAWIERATYHQAVRDVATLLRTAQTAAQQQGRDVGVHAGDGGRLLSFGSEPQYRVVLPAELDVRVEPLDTASAGTAAPAGDMPLFVFRADGSAYGGRLALLRGSRGVAFQINWALGAIEQIEVTKPVS